MKIITQRGLHVVSDPLLLLKWPFYANVQHKKGYWVYRGELYGLLYSGHTVPQPNSAKISSLFKWTIKRLKDDDIKMNAWQTKCMEAASPTTHADLLEPFSGNSPIGEIWTSNMSVWKCILSCRHYGNLRYLHIPKITLCFICKKPLLLLRS